MELPKRRLPNWLYRAVPHLYLWIGFVTTVVEPNFVGSAAGLLLMMASAAVWFARDRYRRPFQESKGSIRMPTSPERDVRHEAAQHIAWSDLDECDDALLNAQRRRLFGLCNELAGESTAGQGSAQLKKLTQALVVFMAEHFHEEESLQASMNQPLSRKHQEQHDSLLAKAQSLRERLQVGESVAHGIAIFAAYDLIKGHLSNHQHAFPAAPIKRHTARPAADSATQTRAAQSAFVFLKESRHQVTPATARRERGRVEEGAWTSHLVAGSRTDRSNESNRT